ncbi:MAG: 1,4-dihydroxy-2-naphthoate polyprenyltransferase [Microthrixaceae bacterium]
MSAEPATQPRPPTDWRKWVLGARPRTLPAAVAPVLVGTAAAGRDLRLWAFACALGVAMFVQVATNYANDYSDGTRGTDDPGERVGPPRLVGNGLASPSEVKRAMLIAFALTALCGLPLVVFVSPWLLFVGAAAMAAGWLYTGGPSPYGYAGFGEVFVFVFFGLVATIGSCFVQTESWSWLAFGCGVAMGCLATALLVVNNLRDIPGDTRSGKRTLAVRLGDRRTRYLYVALLVVAMMCVPLIAGLSARLLAAVSLLAVVPARRPVVAVLGGARGAALIAVLADTAKVQMVFGGLLAAGLFLAS